MERRWSSRHAAEASYADRKLPRLQDKGHRLIRLAANTKRPAGLWRLVFLFFHYRDSSVWAPACRASAAIFWSTGDNAAFTAGMIAVQRAQQVTHEAAAPDSPGGPKVS